MDRKHAGKSAPDGGYGWFVCAAACVVHFVLAGLANNFGILYIHILEEFGGGKGMSALVGSLNIGMMCLVSPFTVIVSNWWGPRITGLIGGVLCVAGLAMSSFVGDLYMLCLTFGVVYGIGASFCNTVTFSVLSMWFDKQLALVNALCTVAVFISTSLFSPILQHLLVALGLSRTLLIMAVISCTTSMAALVYRPPPGWWQNRGAVEKPATRFLDLSVLKNKPFLVLTFGLMAYCMGGYTPAVFVPLFAKESGVPEENLPYLLIIWSCFSILSSFVLGRIADKFRTHRLMICQITMFGVACTTAFFAAVSDFVSFMSLMAVYGVFKCGFILLRPVLVEDIVGPVNTPNAIGVMFGFLGIVNLASPPFTGWIFDMTQSYPLVFVVAAGFVTAGCGLFFLVPVLQAREDKAYDQKHRTTCCQVTQDSVLDEQKSKHSYIALVVEMIESLEPPVHAQKRGLSAVTYASDWAIAIPGPFLTTGEEKEREPGNEVANDRETNV